jgi:hypothetical protein
MRKIVLTTAAFLLLSGTAFAGSDNYGSNYNYGSGDNHSMAKPSAASDHTYSLDLSGTSNIDTLNSAPTVKGKSSFDYPAPGYGRGIWGR